VRRGTRSALRTYLSMAVSLIAVFDLRLLGSTLH
jgi:hypothetical protein